MTTQDWIEKPRRCVICGKIYTDLQTVGRLECTEHRSMCMVFMNGRWVWPCCGKIYRGNHYTTQDFYARRYAPELRGCIAADHKETLEPYCLRPKLDHYVHAYQEGSSSWRVSSLAISRNQIVPVRTAPLEGTEGKNVIVYRYDIAQTQSKNVNK